MTRLSNEAIFTLFRLHKFQIMRSMDKFGQCSLAPSALFYRAGFTQDETFHEIIHCDGLCVYSDTLGNYHIASSMDRREEWTRDLLAARKRRVYQAGLSMPNYGDVYGDLSRPENAIPQDMVEAILLLPAAR